VNNEKSMKKWSVSPLMLILLLILVASLLSNYRDSVEGQAVRQVTGPSTCPDVSEGVSGTGFDFHPFLAKLKAVNKCKAECFAAELVCDESGSLPPHCVGLERFDSCTVTGSPWLVATWYGGPPMYGAHAKGICKQICIDYRDLPLTEFSTPPLGG